MTNRKLKKKLETLKVWLSFFEIFQLFYLFFFTLVKKIYRLIKILYFSDFYCREESKNEKNIQIQRNTSTKNKKIQLIYQVIFFIFGDLLYKIR